VKRYADSLDNMTENLLLYLERFGINTATTTAVVSVVVQTLERLSQTLQRFAQEHSKKGPYVGTAAVLLLSSALLGIRVRRHALKSPSLSESDLQYMNRAKSLIKRCNRPIHSGFLVASVVVYEDLNGEERFEVGVNSETCVLSSAICAERCALVQMRLRKHGFRSLKTVYITATSNELITPGLLCREFMMEYLGKNDETRVVLFSQLFDGNVASSPSSSWTIHQLRDLYPFPPLYHRVPRDALLRRGEELSIRNAPFDSSSASLLVRSNSHVALPPSRFQQLYDSVLRIAQHDRKESDTLYPIHLAAGVLFADASTERTRQDKALEYGCTIDCVSKLSHAIEAGAARGCNPIFIITLDQFGVCWPPSAPARAWLTEALSSVKVTLPVHEADGTINFVTQDELSPALPAISLVPSISVTTTTSSSSSSSSTSSSSSSGHHHSSPVGLTRAHSSLSSSSSSYSSSSSLHHRPEFIQDGYGTPPRLEYSELSQLSMKQQQQQQQKNNQISLKQQPKKSAGSSSLAATKQQAVKKAAATSKLLNAVKKIEKFDGIRAFEKLAVQG
jgi:cytidine deaminase